MAFKVQCKITDTAKHQGDIECVLYHDDKIYTGADDGVIKVWNLNLDLQGEVKAHQYSVYHLAINKDASLLYSCSNDGTICSWKLPGLEAGQTLTAHTESVRKLRFNSDGHLFSGDEAGFIVMWKNGQDSHGFESLGEEIWDMVLDGDLIVTARDRDVVISQIKEDSSNVLCKATFPGRAPLCLVKDRIYFVARAGMNIGAHYNVSKKYEKITEMKGHDRIVNAIASSDCGQFLFTGGYDNSLRVWNLDTHKNVATLPLDFCVNAITVAPNGDVFVAGGDSMLVKFKKS